MQLIYFFLIGCGQLKYKLIANKIFWGGGGGCGIKITKYSISNLCFEIQRFKLLGISNEISFKTFKIR